MTEKSEFRQNVVSGDWVLIAPVRGRRPHASVETPHAPASKDECPFEDPQKTNGVDPLLWYDASGKRGEGRITRDWSLQVIPNKYPLVTKHEGACPVPPTEGFTRSMAAAGFHELVIPRAHDTFFADMALEEAERMVRAYQDRIVAHKDEDCLHYVLVFHNHGTAAGASIYHPHSQILALPFVPHDVRRSVLGSRAWFEKNGTCIHCEIIAAERVSGERIVYENKKFIVLVPYAPSASFEMRIFPITHGPDFYTIADDDRLEFAEAIVNALKRLKKTLNDPAYNFFIHTAPVDRADYRYYHWHMEIVPKTSHFAGFELGLGIRAVSAVPEESAELLRTTQ